MLSEAEEIELAELEELERLERAHGGQPQESIVQEQSPLISRSDRATIKNFANSDEAAIKYLQQKNPDAEVKMMDGQLVVRGQGEKDFKVLDPDTGLFSADILNDVSDIGWDVVDGVGTTLGTAGGAAVGALGLNPATVGLGAVAGGAASGAALEASRQQIGKSLGLPQEIDGTDVMISGVAGGASPLLFGQGTSAKTAMKAGGGVNAIKKALGMASGEITQEGAEKIAKGMKGAIPWSIAKVPDTLGFMSGKGGDSVRRLSKDIDYVDNVEMNGSLATEAERVADQLGQGFDKRMDQVGGQLADAIDSSGKKVNVGPAKAEFNKTISELERQQQEANTPMLQAQIAKIRNAYDRLFSIPGSDAKPGPSIDMTTGKAFPTLPPQVADEVSGRTARKLQQDVKSFAKFSPQLGVSAEESAADTLLRGAAGKSYGAMNSSLDAATDGVSSELKGQYKSLADLERAMEPSFRNPKTVLSTARNLDKDGHTMTRLNLERAKSLGIDGAEDFDKFTSAAQWSNLPRFNPSVVGNLPAAAIGASAGYYAGAQSGMGQGGAGLGAGAGGLAGAALGGPRAVKFYVRQAAKMGKALDKPAINALKNAPLPPPNLMSRGLYDYLSDEKN